jgi:hypothetical protein
MPIFLAAFLGGLLSAMSSVVGRVLVALGITYVSYTGITILIDWIADEFADRIGDAPLAVVQVLGVLQVDTCFSILMSAISARLILKGLNSGAITKAVIR